MFRYAFALVIRNTSLRFASWLIRHSASPRDVFLQPARERIKNTYCMGNSGNVDVKRFSNCHRHFYVAFTWPDGIGYCDRPSLYDKQTLVCVLS